MSARIRLLSGIVVPDPGGSRVPVVLAGAILPVFSFFVFTVLFGLIEGELVFGLDLDPSGIAALIASSAFLCGCGAVVGLGVAAICPRTAGPSRGYRFRQRRLLMMLGPILLIWPMTAVALDQGAQLSGGELLFSILLAGVGLVTPVWLIEGTLRLGELLPRWVGEAVSVMLSGLLGVSSFFGALMVTRLIEGLSRMSSVQDLISHVAQWNVPIWRDEMIAGILGVGLAFATVTGIFAVAQLAWKVPRPRRPHWAEALSSVLPPVALLTMMVLFVAWALTLS